MATLVLGAVGASLGGAVGGSVLGLTSAAIGKAIGASIGSAIDQRLLGTGSAPVHAGRMDALRLQGASAGEPVPRVFGRMRVAGNVIWASRFLETTKKSGGGKGNPRRVINYSYSVSLAVALCEGEVTRIGRIWADGSEISPDSLNWRLVPGTETQTADPLIEAIEGIDNAPAYRGIAYVVFEDLDLSPFGNRVPQFNIEVIRKVAEPGNSGTTNPYDSINSVALVPGSGEYALATTPVRFDQGKGVSSVVNRNGTSGRSDIECSLEQLTQELPNVSAVSLVVSWFGSDLRCGSCQIEPKVEQNQSDPAAMPWHAGGIDRTSAMEVSRIDGRPAFGGTPADASVVEALQLASAMNLSVTFYPFVLMDIPPANALPDPWTGGIGQPVFPWRGRITLDAAPGIAGTVDQSAAAASDVAAFFGTAAPGDFSVSGSTVAYIGPAEWTYRRFILHYAHLCAAVGGVETFIIGSELRGLTAIRDSATTFPAVAMLQSLAADVRSILGPNVKISYAADWSEYFGHHPSDGSGDVFFHLDPLWADSNIDFVGIDNYMPLSDWRDTDTHLDQSHGSIYDLDYLKGNIEGGEGYDWYYLNQADRDLQIRLPVSDGAYGEDWVFRYKDLRSWWSMPHHNRPGGVREAGSTAWIPESKPIVFTEFGCPAIDKGTNQPNVFFDPKSDESEVPYYSTRVRDDFIQYRYLQAHFEHWEDSANNPLSALTGLAMVDTTRMSVWAWDTRPWPEFPNRIDIWSDGENYKSGHWISGRTGLAPLAAVVGQLAEESGFTDYDVSQLHGAVHGFEVSDVETTRQSLQPLMLSHAFDGFEVDGTCKFKNRIGLSDRRFETNALALSEEKGPLEFARTTSSDTASNIQIRYYHSKKDYQLGTATVGVAAASSPSRSATDLPIAMSASEEARIARDVANFSLPPSQLDISVGDVVDLPIGGERGLFRIDRIEEAGLRICEATRIEMGVYRSGSRDEDPLEPRQFSLPAPVYVEFLDLPLLADTDVAHAPLIAAAGVPWLGPVAVYVSSYDGGYQLNTQVNQSAVVGTFLTPLPARAPDLWVRGDTVDIELTSGSLVSRTESEVLNGANLSAIRNPGDTDWEIIQFADAQLISPNVYRLSNFLRGQAGTEFAMPVQYVSGADFVLLDGRAEQVDYPLAERGLEKNFRIGPASRPLNDDSYTHIVGSFPGAGLRPYAPVHVSARSLSNGDVETQWIRQSRIDGESWQGADVPLGEDTENYLIRIEKSGSLLRELSSTTPGVTYTASMQAADGALLPFEISVAQTSAQYGPGPFRRIVFNG